VVVTICRVELWSCLCVSSATFRSRLLVTSGVQCVPVAAVKLSSLVSSAPQAPSTLRYVTLLHLSTCPFDLVVSVVVVARFVDVSLLCPFATRTFRYHLRRFDTWTVVNRLKWHAAKRPVQVANWRSSETSCYPVALRPTRLVLWWVIVCRPSRYV